jgi:beta-lactamase regulating signal transducer with metallopeptidase domain/beta-lactamase class D
MTNAMNPFLELLSHTAIKGSVVLLVALVAGLSLRKVAAARRYVIWITAVAALAVLPLAMTLLPAWRVLPQTNVAMDRPVFETAMPDENPESTLLPVEAKISIPGSSFEAQAPAPVKSRPAFSWQDAVDSLPAAWITLSALLLLRLGWSAWRLHRLERSLEPGNCAALDEITREIGLKRVPRLLIGTANAVPMVWGVWRPRLLLPAGFESWTSDKLRGVLLHELAHLKRGDPLALWTAQWVKALHWFNPLAWLTIRQLRADQERACDDAVLRHGVRASDYAQHLLDLSRHTRIAPGLALCALTITRCAPVEARVKAILDPKRRREGLTPRWLLGLAGFALLTTLPVAMLHAIEGAKLRGRILDRNGVVLAESTPEKARHYPLKTLAAHMIGYTHKADDPLPKMEGYTGIEKQQDAALAAGKDVTLAFDMRIQSLAHRAMSEAGVTRGAAVVLDPRTGEVLAAVSLPSYDPNIFVPSISHKNWDVMLKDLDHPLLNRCVRGFAPGSSYKLLTGLAGSAAGISGQKFNCTGSVTYSSTVMQCWKQRQDGGGHGVLGMSDALAASCNCYWYQFGNAAGIEEIESMGRKIGFGGVYGVSDHEDAGILPSPTWLKQHRPTEKWSAGYTANTAIGQGMVLATPLQMAVLAATVGNGGKVPQPGIIKQNGESPWRADLIEGTLTAAAVGQLREGMRLVVNGDFASKAAKSDKFIIAGKTGTAQNWRRDANGAKQDDNHGWFIGFAPFENPKLAFAIIKNGAKSGGGDCGPIAKRIVEEALALPADGSGEVKPAWDAWEKEEAQRSAFDAKAEAISSAIKRAKPDAKAGFVLAELKIGRGEVTLHGTASGMIQTLEFRAKLEQIGSQFEMEWEFPVPKTMMDGKRVEFQASGIYRPHGTKMKGKLLQKQSPPSSVLKEARDNPQDRHVKLDELKAKLKALKNEKPFNQTAYDELVKEISRLSFREQARPAEYVRDIETRPIERDRWQEVQRSGGLADLPTEALVQVLKDRDTVHLGSLSSFYFRFSASREAVRAWLLASLSEKRQKSQAKGLAWPKAPEAFDRAYYATGECVITIHCPDGKLVQVTVEKRKRPMLIAPDEATPPTPKTAAPKELKGVVSVDSQWPAPPVVLMNHPFPLHLYVEDTYREEQDELKAAMAQQDSINNRFNKALLARNRPR